MDVVDMFAMFVLFFLFEDMLLFLCNHEPLHVESILSLWWLIVNYSSV